MPSIRLIVGLGNPGEKYIGTRHNAGADFVSALAKQNGIELKSEKKLAGRLGRGTVAGHDLRLMIPDTYICLLYTSPSPRDGRISRMPSSA